ncbi:transglycosylase domain-containing protein [Kitasatospora mediocidica]|uniref:transglycosylase domain-containing protein n=1 Tax=Kitasatospora mediocidica TaxID=58352 RepID=UPI00068BD183|nr:transglycosylase domain-containing protein [Kitasatospora mediocidica]
MPRLTLRRPRNRPRNRPRRTGWRRLVPTWRFALFGTLATLLLGIGLFALGVAVVQVPDAHATATAQSNTWLYRDGTVIAQTGRTNRQSVPLDKVSPDARHAVLAAEDRSFYQEGAVNPKALVRAAWSTATGQGAQGGSTITQQYVKNAYLTQQQTVSRKVRELFIALKVDATLSKDEILADYLNTTYYGRGAYGIQAAAQAYFGIDADRLNPAQGAYLAALLNAPSAYDVSTAGPAGERGAKARWNYVLDAMVQEHWLSADDRARATFPEVLKPQSTPGLSGQAGYLVEAAKRSLLAQGVVDEAALARGGYRITLSIDPARQQDLTTAVARQLTDRLAPDRRDKDADVQAGAVSVDPKTGALLALYGGTDYTAHYVDNANRRDYQAGSTFKAIALAAALESGAKTQDGRTIDAATGYDGTSGRPVRGGTAKPPYAPPNEDDRSFGPVTLQQATSWSVNSAFAQLAQDTGLSTVRDTAVALGLPDGTGELRAEPALPLGVSTPSVLDMAGVYATLDNDGRQITPWIVQSLQLGGTGVALPSPQVKQAVSPDTARKVTSMLRGVVSDPGGTGHRAKALDRPVAGKTGTTDGNRSAWFVGYTPELVTSVAMFGEQAGTGNQVSLSGAAGGGRVNGGGFPAQIWTDYMKAALKDRPVTGFDPPAVDRPTTPTSPTGTPGHPATATPSGTATADPATPPTTPPASPEAPAPPAPPTSPTNPTNPTRPSPPTTSPSPTTAKPSPPRPSPPTSSSTPTASPPAPDEDDPDRLPQ